MNKFNVAFFAALLVLGACAEPRKLLANTEGSTLAEAQEHQRILAELEEVHALRERMLQEGKPHLVIGTPEPAIPLLLSCLSCLCLCICKDLLAQVAYRHELCQGSVIRCLTLLLCLCSLHIYLCLRSPCTSTYVKLLIKTTDWQSSVPCTAHQLPALVQVEALSNLTRTPVVYPRPPLDLSCLCQN